MSTVLSLPRRPTRIGDGPQLDFTQRRPCDGKPRYRATDDTHAGYTYSVLRFAVDHPVLDATDPEPSVMSGMRNISFGLYTHLRNVSIHAETTGKNLGLNGLSNELGIAGLGHDISKPRYPEVFGSGKSYSEMGEDERRIVNLHPFESAEIVRMCGYPVAARIIVTAASLNRRHAEQYHDLQDIEIFEPRTDEYVAAQILETVDQALAMRETGDHRRYRERPMTFEEISARLPQQVFADEAVIKDVLQLMKEALC